MNANILILVVFIAAMYFIMIRPQQKAQKKRQAMINDVQPGAQIVTIGGMHGTVASVNKEARTFELDAEGIILVFELSAIRQVSKEGNKVSAETTVVPETETETETKAIEEDTTSEDK